jgi:hypothetical protein
MMKDEKGLDTVFGALILIMVCLMASSALIAFGTSNGPGSPDIQDFEREYDCILSSTLNLKYSIGGSEIDRQFSVETYAIEMLSGAQGDLLSPEKNASGGISSLIDFYFSGFGGWSLRLNDSRLGSVELASRSPMIVETRNTYVLSRPLIGWNGGEASLDLTIFQ